MVIYSQSDKRWKNKILGYDNTTTIGDYGCLLTCMSMVTSNCNESVNPEELNTRLKNVNGFAQGTAYVKASYLDMAVNCIKFEHQEFCREHPAPLYIIDNALSEDKNVIIELDYSVVRGLQTHWVIITEKLEGGDYKIIDPYPTDNQVSTLVTSYGHSSDKPETIITGIIIYKCTCGDHNSGESELQAGVEEYGVLVNSLNIRTNSSTLSNIVGNFAQGDIIRIIDSVDNEEGKWLKLENGNWVCELYRLAEKI